MNRNLFPVAVLALLAGCIGSWPGGEGAGLGEARVGWIYVGPVGDHGWTKTHDDARLYLEDELGVETQYEPSVIPVDAPPVIDQFVESGDNVIITTSFDFVSATQGGAAKYPDVNFLSCSGFVSAQNLGSYFGRMYQAFYLAGQVAAHKSCTKRIGIVSPVTIPETVRHINAITLGARSVDPEIEVHVEWIGNWFDVELEPVVTQKLIDGGADVIVNHTDTTIPLETADGQTTFCEAAGSDVPVYTIGYDNPDSCEFAPGSCLTSPYWNWGPLITRLIDEMQQGTWDPTELPWEQMKGTPEDSVVYLSEISTSLVDSSTRLAVESEISDLTAPSGARLPFRGPLTDVSGELRVFGGDEMTDEELLRMCWFVDGVVNVDNTGATIPGVVPPGCGGDY